MPRIYVASLTDYTCGVLHGAWISLDDSTDLDDVLAQVNTMLADSPAVRNELSHVAEEYAIHDYEDFGGYTVDEYTPLERVVAVAAAIAEHGDAFAMFLNDRPNESVETSVANFTDRMCGTWQSGTDFAWADFEEVCPDAFQQTTSYDWVQFDPGAYVRAHEMDGYAFIDTSSGTTVLTPDH
jgi:antirestriction protein